MSDGSVKRVNPAVVMGGDEEVVRPVRVSTKGTTTYPFEELEVGRHFFVYRTVRSVREALKRWQDAHKEAKVKRFESWRGKDRDGRACVFVKRAK